jgi:hypothetical protein
MQVTANRPLAARPVAKAVPAAAPAKPAGQAPQPAKPVKARNADAGFGSEIFQNALYGLMNLGQVVPLPGGVSGLIQMLPASMLGVFNVVMGGFNAFKDWRSLKSPANTRNSDNYTRLAGDAGIVVGGVALLAGAAIAPVVPLIGAAVAAAGFATRIVGVWNDESRW